MEASGIEREDSAVFGRGAPGKEGMKSDLSVFTSFHHGQIVCVAPKHPSHPIRPAGDGGNGEGVQTSVQRQLFFTSSDN
jgi:hypothetical protein